MRPSPAKAVRLLQGTLVLLAVTTGCGEFHTDRFTDPLDTAKDISDDVQEVGPRCRSYVALQLAEDRDLTNIVVGVPYHQTLLEETGNATLWLVIQGALPAGLSLDPLTGLLSGVPAAPGDGSMTVRVTAVDADGTCFLLDEAIFPWTVTTQCEEDADCSPLVSQEFREAGGKAWCGDDSRCLLSNGCPNDPRQRVGFFLSLSGNEALPVGDDGLIAGGEVVDHARFEGPKNPDELRRQVLIRFKEYNSAVLTLDYTLPDNWPLPLRVGDAVSVRVEDGVLNGEALHIVGPGGPGHLLQGFRVPGEFPDTLPLPELRSITPMACPSFDDPCGDLAPAGATFEHGATAWTLTPGDTVWIPDPSRPPADPEALLVRLGWSFFRDMACDDEPPTELSALFLPADDCPGAVAKAESPQYQLAGQALAAPPVLEVSGWASFSPGQDGALVSAAWTVEFDPFWSVEYDPLGGGFGHLEPTSIALPDPLGLGSRRLVAGAVGEYRIGLSVEDDEGRPSCITDTIHFQVIADPEVALRAELFLLPVEPPGAEAEDGIELYMRPSGSAAWDDPTRVCGPASPLPEFFGSAQCAVADLPGGRPALATLKTLAPTKSYGFALRAPETNTAPLVHAPGDGQQIILRLFCDAKALDFGLPDGFTLSPGELVEVARIAPDCVLETLL